MTKKSLRQQYIDDIMSSQYADDDPKYDDRNRNFLEGLSIGELEEIASRSAIMDAEEFEEDIELDGEIFDYEDELFN